MPDPSNALETALRQIRDVVPGLDKRQMTLIRATLINFKNTPWENSITSKSCSVAVDGSWREQSA